MERVNILCKGPMFVWFLFDPEARAEILTIISLFFLENLRYIPQFCSEIVWPLLQLQSCTTNCSTNGKISQCANLLGHGYNHEHFYSSPTYSAKRAQWNLSHGPNGTDFSFCFVCKFMSFFDRKLLFFFGPRINIYFL